MKCAFKLKDGWQGARSPTLGRGGVQWKVKQESKKKISEVGVKTLGQCRQHKLSSTPDLKLAWKGWTGVASPTRGRLTGQSKVLRRLYFHHSLMNEYWCVWARLLVWRWSRATRRADTVSDHWPRLLLTVVLVYYKYSIIYCVTSATLQQTQSRWRLSFLLTNFLNH